MKKHILEETVWGVIPIINYKGCLVTKTKKGYSIFGEDVETPEEVDKILNKALITLGNTIVKEDDLI